LPHFTSGNSSIKSTLSNGSLAAIPIHFRLTLLHPTDYAESISCQGFHSFSPQEPGTSFMKTYYTLCVTFFFFFFFLVFVICFACFFRVVILMYCCI
jgi:hypothetical protein